MVTSSVELLLSITENPCSITKIESLLLEALRSELQCYGCIEHRTDCTGCDKTEACPYHTIFESLLKTEDLSSPIAISINEKGDRETKPEFLFSGSL